MPRKLSEKVEDFLNLMHLWEIGAIGVYMDQHYRAKDAGYDKLASLFEDDAKEEMKHAEKLAERILEIGGEIKYDKHIVPEKGPQDITDFIATNIRLEIEAIEAYNNGIRTCFEEGDNVSRMLLEEILQDEEKHLGMYENMLTNIDKYGSSYIVTHLM